MAACRAGPNDLCFLLFTPLILYNERLVCGTMPHGHATFEVKLMTFVRRGSCDKELMLCDKSNMNKGVDFVVFQMTVDPGDS